MSSRLRAEKGRVGRSLHCVEHVHKARTYRWALQIKKAELARRLGWHMPRVDRLFDLRHASRIDQIEAAARAGQALRDAHCLFRLFSRT
jgi:hypothetical protein